MATALASLVTGKPVAADVAMTGEITLTGQVLPIGGVKEKALAAERAGITTVILPKDNEPDLGELPEDVRTRLEFVPVRSIDQVLARALKDTRGGRGRRIRTETERKAASST
jgi:ATP-dependent Lon protease